MYNSALRPFVMKRLEEMERADLIIGIPAYYNEKTIVDVIRVVSNGLFEYFRNLRAVIFVSDGGSTDDTRDVSKDIVIKPWQERIITIYRGQPGKGSAIRAVFEAAVRLKVQAGAMVDSDLRSITSEWIHHLVEPVLNQDYQFVAPIYTRHKYDGTITNNIAYNLTRALYGKRIRQPIGGEFAFSRDLAEAYLKEDVWETDIAKFGIDIFMTTNAIAQGFRIAQARLGVKIHDAKDPGFVLGPMFKQVVGTLFSLMERFESLWMSTRGSETVETFGVEEYQEPEPIEVNLKNLVREFQVGFRQFRTIWEDILCPECFAEVGKAADMSTEDLKIPMLTWVQALYDIAATFHRWELNRKKLLQLMTPLYLGRVASFVNETRNMDSRQAEELVEEQAQAFEDRKDYLIERWQEAKKEPVELEDL